jgi:hypothetical protein
MYSIAIKIDGIESRKRSSGLLHIVIGLFLIAKGSQYFQLIHYGNFWTIAPMLLIASFSLFYGFFRKKVDLSAHYNYWLRLVQVIAFTVLGVLLAGVGRPVDYVGAFIFAFLCIILMFSERRIFQDTVLTIDESGIKVPGYYREHLVRWNELTEVVVREDFITLFHVRQKYLQFQVMQDLSTLEVAKMNAFCKEQIERVAIAAANN